MDVSESQRIEELRQRVEKDPSSIAFAQLAEEYRRVGNYEEAVSVCRGGLAQHPAYVSARVTLARALMELAQFDEARAELEAVLDLAPDNLAAIRALADHHQRHGGGETLPIRSRRPCPPLAAKPRRRRWPRPTMRCSRITIEESAPARAPRNPLMRWFSICRRSRTSARSASTRRGRCRTISRRRRPRPSCPLHFDPPAPVAAPPAFTPAAPPVAAIASVASGAPAAPAAETAIDTLRQWLAAIVQDRAKQA